MGLVYVKLIEHLYLYNFVEYSCRLIMDDNCTMYNNSKDASFPHCPFLPPYQNVHKSHCPSTFSGQALYHTG